MILVDANILIYAYNQSAVQHAAAKEWLDSQLSGNRRVGLPWPSLLAFLRIVTNPRAFRNPRTIRETWQHAEKWLHAPSVWIPIPTERHVGIFGQLLSVTEANSNLVSDAHLAALAIEHGLELCTTDRDFARFPGLRWRNPIAESR